MATQGDNDKGFRLDGCSATVSRDGDRSVTVNLAGEFDLATAADLRECLVQSEVIDVERVRVDLAAVTFCDSSSIGLLVTACKRVRSAGGAFSVHCGESVARRVLEISGLIDFFGVEDAAVDRLDPDAPLVG
jgi:anti-sigma B factor antagonist